MAVNKKKNVFGDDFFRDFDEVFREMQGEMQDLFSRMENVKSDGKPLVYGFRVNVGPDGKPHFEEFGNVKPGKGVEDVREPMADVIDGKSEVTVIFELPGVDKKDVRLSSARSMLVLEVVDPHRRYAKQVKLPAEVDEGSAKANLKNGILEVVLRKLKPSAPKKNLIRVE